MQDQVKVPSPLSCLFMALVADLRAAEHLLVAIGGRGRLLVACWWLVASRTPVGGY